MKKKQQIIAISDSHSKHVQMTNDILKIDNLEESILIHAGDISNVGHSWEIEDFLAWYSSFNTYRSIFCLGNHDWMGEIDPDGFRKLLTKYPKLIYLENSEVIIDGVKYYGSPASPTFFNWAFNFDRGPKIKAIWDEIPDDTNVLITHSPCYGYGDDVESSYYNNYDTHAGCKDLLDRVNELPKLRIHITGHLHEGYGLKHHKDGKNITFINAAMLDDDYKYTHKPTVINYEY